MGGKGGRVHPPGAMEYGNSDLPPDCSGVKSNWGTHTHSYSSALSTPNTMVTQSSSNCKCQHPNGNPCTSVCSLRFINNSLCSTTWEFVLDHPVLAQHEPLGIGEIQVSAVLSISQAGTQLWDFTPHPQLQRASALHGSSRAATLGQEGFYW